MDINYICKIIDNGGLVVMPTDTIYGIMADATSEDVIRKVYEVKRRSYSKPLILLMDSYEMIKFYTEELTLNEEKLIKKFMPGLVTIILKKNDRINNLITANSDYVGIRIPDDENLLKIINKLGRPIISTSANISDDDIITSIDMLDEEIKNNVSYIYDGGKKTSVASTIVKFEDENLKILREGKLSDEIRNAFLN